MLRTIQAKSILSRLKEAPDPYFGITYNMNLYRGCQHACIYCDSRSKVYQLGNLSDIRIKENAIELLHQELKAKRHKGTIGTGSMNDPYMPVEAKAEHTRKALQTIYQHRYPVHVMTKSDLVVRDTDILTDITKTYAAVSFSITTADDSLSKKIEPGAVVSSKRFTTMKQLADKGIYTGVILTPVLPFITDKPKAIKELVQKAKDNGAQYLLCWMGMTLREGQREYFYDKLDTLFPGMSRLYQQHYENEYSCEIPNTRECWEVFVECCERNNLPMHMRFYAEDAPRQLGLFDTA